MIPLIVIGVIVLVIIIWAAASYNGFIQLRNKTEEAYSAIDVSLKKRYDLIPNYVETVKGYAKHEKETLQNVISARNSAMESAGPEERMANENMLTGALRSLFAVAENYPDLKANQNFMHLQEEIADLENKLAAVRRYFNSATRELNNAVETFPSNLVAGMFGFKKEIMFDLGEQRTSLEEAPKINF